MMERQDKVVLTLDSYEHGIMIRALNELRNDMLEEQRDPGGQCKNCPYFYCRLRAGHWHLSLIQAQLPQGRGTRFRRMGRSASREQEIPG